MMDWSCHSLIRGDLLKFACSKMYHDTTHLDCVFHVCLGSYSYDADLIFHYHSRLLRPQYLSLVQMHYWSLWPLTSLLTPWARRRLELRLFCLIRLRPPSLFLHYFKFLHACMESNPLKLHTHTHTLSQYIWSIAGNESFLHPTCRNTFLWWPCM